MDLRVKRTLIALAVVGAIVILNQLVSFPMSMRAGDWRQRLGDGPAGPPLVRAYRLLEHNPKQKDAPFMKEALSAMSSARLLAEGTPYYPSSTLGKHNYHESNRPVIMAPAPATISYLVTAPPKSVLTFGYGVKHEIDHRLQNGARFIVEWSDADGVRRLFEDEVHPRPRGFWEQSKDRERVWYRYVRPRLAKRGDYFREAVVDLSELGGKGGQLRLITEIIAKDSSLTFSPSLWSNPEIWAERLPGDEPPINVVLFMIEATPATMVEPYAGAPGVTPHLRAFANDAVVFDKFFAVGDSTQLSTFSFFTGRHYRSMGLPNEIYYLAPLVKSRFYRQRFATLAEAFSRAGYRTAEIGTNHYFNPTRDFGLDLGFDQLEITGRRSYEAIDTTLVAMEWLRAHADKPFFLYVHYDAPHDEEKPALEDLADALLAGGDDWRWRYRKYLAQVIRADKDFGRLLTALDELDVRERTLVVVTADHGNCVDPAREFAVVREGRRPWRTPFQHGRALSNEDVHIPLMIDWPIGDGDGRRDPTPLASIDLFPTLVELLVEPEDDLAARMADLDGKSFAQLLTHGPGATAGHDAIYSISQGGESLLVDGRYHYHRRSPAYEKILFPGATRLEIVKERLHDLETDPNERVDLTTTRPELLAQMRDELWSARPEEATLRLLFLNYESGTVRARMGLGQRGSGRKISQAVTFPPDRAPIRLDRPRAGAETLALGGDEYVFETELTGPTGLILEDPLQWISIQHGSTIIAAGDLRLGPHGLPILAGTECATPKHEESGALPLEHCDQLPAGILATPRHPTQYLNEPGVYFYQMNFSDFVAQTFSNEELSPAVQAMLKQWGYIE